MKSFAFMTIIMFCSVGVAQLQHVTYEDVGVTSPQQTYCTFLEAERTWGLRSSYHIDHFQNVLDKLNATLDSHNKFLDLESYWIGMHKKDSKRDENLEKFHQLNLQLFKEAGFDIKKDIQVDKGHILIHDTFIKFGDVLARPVFNSKLNQLDLQLIRRFTDLQDQMRKAAEAGKPMRQLTDEQKLKLRMIDYPAVVKSNGRAYIMLYPDPREIALETVESRAKTTPEECR